MTGGSLATPDAIAKAIAAVKAAGTNSHTLNNARWLSAQFA
jgi:hypothetical protein